MYRWTIPATLTPARYLIRATCGSTYLAITDTACSDLSDGSVTITAPAAQPTPVSFEAESGTLAAPFTATGGYVSQPNQTTLDTGGKATYRFNLAANGTYVVKGFVSAQNDAANSFFLEIDAEPTDPAAVWHIPITSGFEWRTASWQGSGTWDNSEFVPKYFNLTSGEHTLIIRGREGGALLDKITIEPVAAGTTAYGDSTRNSGRSAFMLQLSAIMESLRTVLSALVNNTNL